MRTKEPFYDKIEKVIIIVMMIGMTVLTFFTVCSRYLFGFTLSWAEQLERLMMIYMFFAGMSLASMRDVHYRVTVMTMVFRKSPKTVNAIMWIGDIAMIIFGFYMTYLTGSVTHSLIESQSVLPSLTFVPKWIQYLPGSIGMLGVSLRIIQRRYREIKGTKIPEALQMEGGMGND